MRIVPQQALGGETEFDDRLLAVEGHFSTNCHQSFSTIFPVCPKCSINPTAVRISFRG